VEIGTTNGMLTEIVSGIGEGTEVLTDFSLSGGEEEQDEKASNPFMPKPKNNKNNQNKK
jgi:HlyD family secretion protein